ncbi:MAG: ATP-binding cassette domain-containing protein [Holosporales bacterium]|nr:ATP-binding cassette domain-containing protein [Holosporales bacterium]
MSIASSTAKEIVGLEHVGLQYNEGRPVFRNISYCIFAGDFYFLTGQSGMGKTSLLKILYRAVMPSYGNVRVFGYDVGVIDRSDLPTFRQHIGLIFQDCRLIDNLSIVDNVALSMHIGGSQYKKSCTYARELLDWVGLGDFFDAFPDALSDGQKQRVAIARAVVKRPALLLADEPTGNLDDDNAMRLMALFEELHRMGTTIIFATHNNQIIKSFPYSKLVLRNGSLFVGQPQSAQDQVQEAEQTEPYAPKQYAKRDALQPDAPTKFGKNMEMGVI